MDRVTRLWGVKWRVPRPVMILLLRILRRLQRFMSRTLGRTRAAQIIRPWPMPLSHPALDQPGSVLSGYFRGCAIGDLRYRGVPAGRLPAMRTDVLLTMLAVLRQLDGVTNSLERLVIFRSHMPMLRRLGPWAWVYVRDVQRHHAAFNGLQEPHLSYLLDEVWGGYPGF